MFVLSQVIRIPKIQAYVLERLTERLEEATKMPTSIEYIDFNWINRLELHDLRIRDTKGLEFINVHRLKVKFDWLSVLFKEHQVVLNDVLLERAIVGLNYSEKDAKYTLVQWNDGLANLFSGDNLDSIPKNTEPFTFLVERIRLEDCQFFMLDPSADPISHGFDYLNFSLKEISGNLKEMKIIEGTFSAQINGLTCLDNKTSLRVHDLSTYYFTSDSLMKFYDFDLKVGESQVKTTMEWKYKNYDMSDFNHDVNIIANIHSSSIYSKDLGQFTESVYNLPARHYQISGESRGTVNNFDAENLKIAFGKDSKVYLGGTMIGLPDVEQTYMNLHFSESKVTSEDLDLYLSEENDYLEKLAYLEFKGVLTGFMTDFVVDGKVNTSIGTFISDLNVKLPNENEEMKYSGRFRTDNLNLGHFLSLPVSLKDIKLTCDVEGESFGEKMSLKSNLTIDNLNLNHYDYKDILCDLSLNQGFLFASLSSNDTNLKFSTDFESNFLLDSSYLKFNGNISKANLQQLGFTKNHQALKMSLEGDIRGLNEDELFGSLLFQNLDLENDSNRLKLPLVRLQSLEEKDKQRSFNFYSPLVEISLKGNFNFNQCLETLPYISDTYVHYLTDDKGLLSKALKSENSLDSSSYDLKYSVHLKDIDPFFDFYNLDYKIAQGSNLYGNLSHKENFSFSARSKADSIQVNNLNFYACDLNLESKKSHGDKPFFTNLTVKVDSSIFYDKVYAEHSGLNLLWENDTIRINNSFRSNQLGAEIDLLTLVDLSAEHTRIKLNARNFMFLEEEWTLGSLNEIVFFPDYLRVENLNFKSTSGNLLLSGNIGNEEKDSLLFTVQDFHLERLNPLLSNSLSGTFNSEVLVNSNKEEKVKVKAVIDSLVLNQISLGNLEFLSFFNKKSNVASVVTNLKAEENHEYFSAHGFYDLEDSISPLNFNLSLNKIPLKLSEEFIRDYVSDMNGFVSGDLELKGNFEKPIIRGDYSIEEGRSRVNYLNTNYLFYAKGNISESKIALDTLTLVDSELHKAFFEGEILHDKFSDFNFNIFGTIDNFLSLNTQAKDNELYYGKAFATGDLKISGPLNNIELDANLSTNEESKLYIPLNSTATSEQQSFINFLEFDKQSDTTVVEELRKDLKQTSDTRYKINLNLNVSPVAEFEILFDKQEGDIISGKGQGNLRLEIDSEEDMRLFGEFSFTKGDYNFTYYNLLSKDFTINPESTISWQGDPYDALVNLNASYKQQVSLTPLFDNLREAPELNKKYPSTVDLKLSGDLLSPEIDFKVNVEDYPEALTVTGGENFGTQLRTYLQSLDRNEQELNRQVFHLIILKSFASDNTFASDANLNSSVSEFVSGQISNLLNEVDDNLEINVDLGDFSEKQLENFQLRLSYSLLNGRLKISRSGGLGNLGNKDGETSLAGAIGDWNIEMDLTKDSKWRLRLYNRSTYSNFRNESGNNNTINNSVFRAGASIMHSTDFDYFKELIGWKKKVKVEPESEEKSDD